MIKINRGSVFLSAITICLALLLLSAIPLASAFASMETTEDRNTFEEQLEVYSNRDYEKPVIVIGDDIYYPPYSFIDKLGNPAGYNVELARAAGAAMGYDVIIKLDSWDKTREALENDEIDAIAGMFYSDSRSEQYTFTTRHSTTSGAIFASSGNEIRSLEELAGQQIAVQSADIVAEILTELNSRLDLNIELIEMPSVREALALVEEGRCNYAGLLKLPALYEIEASGLENVNDQQLDFFSNDYCMAVKKGNDDLAAILNGGLQIIKADGTYQKIYDRWLGIYEPIDIYNMLSQYRYILIITASIVIVLVIFVVSMRFLVKKKTAELLETNQRLLEKKDQLEYISNHDMLTGVYNRRFFDQYVRNIPESQKFPFCLLISDINDLRSLNDRLGHQAGDQLLIKLAQIMLNHKSAQDTICRIGGDEFVILMPGASSYEAETLIHSIRAAAEMTQTTAYELSVSFGFSCITSPNTDIMEAFRQAENMVYEHKKSEKNNFNNLL